MKKSALLLPLLSLACVASMAAVTTTTTVTRHTTRVEPAFPTVVTVHTHPARRHVHRHTVHHAASVNTGQLGGPPAPGTTVTTTVHRHSVRYD